MPDIKSRWSNTGHMRLCCSRDRCWQLIKWRRARHAAHNAAVAWRSTWWIHRWNRVTSTTLHVPSSPIALGSDKRISLGREVAQIWNSSNSVKMTTLCAYIIRLIVNSTIISHMSLTPSTSCTSARLCCGVWFWSIDPTIIFSFKKVTMTVYFVVYH